MRYRSHTLNVWVLLAVLATGHHATADVLEVGSISDEPSVEITKFLPLANYLEDALHPYGVDRVKIVIADSMQEMAALMTDGRVDLFMDSPFPAIAVSELSGSDFLLRRWKKGVGEYHSVIFGRKDSGLTSLEDLKGKIIAFEKPYSSSGCMLPLFSLRRAGFKLRQIATPEDPVPPDEIGFVFTNEDENTVVWVLQGRVIAGAIDNRLLIPIANRSADQQHVLHSTMNVPRHVVLTSPTMSEERKRNLRRALIGMVETQKGRTALHEFERTKKFDEIPDSFWKNLPDLTEFVNQLDLSGTE